MAATESNALAVDAVICITLNDDEERRAALLRHLATIDADLATRLRFLRVSPDRENPHRGCFTSHKEAWHALSGARHGLILEDDAHLLSSSWEECKQTANKWLSSSSSNEWTFLMLGWMPLRASHSGTPHVLRVRAGALSHAYIVNVQSKWLGHVPPYDGIAIDYLIAMREVLARHGYTGIATFAVRPMGVIQRPGVGSNILYRESWGEAAWKCGTCRLRQLVGSAWSNALLRYRLSRRLCEYACTSIHVHSLFAGLWAALLVVMLIVAAAATTTTLLQSASEGMSG